MDARSHLTSLIRTYEWSSLEADGSYKGIPELMRGFQPSVCLLLACLVCSCSKSSTSDALVNGEQCTFGRHVTCLARSRDNTLVACGGSDGWVVVASADISGIARFRAHQDGIQSVAIGPDNMKVATCGIDGTIMIWQVPQIRELARICSGTAKAEGLFFLNGGSQILSATTDGLLQTWDSSTGEPISNAEISGVRIIQILLSEDGKKGVVSGRLRGGERQKVVLAIDFEKRGEVTTLTNDHTQVALTSDGKKAAIARRGAVIDVISTNDGKIISRILAGSRQVSAIAAVCFTNECGNIVTDGGELVHGPGQMEIWNYNTPSKRLARTHSCGVASAMVYVATGKYILSAHSDGRVYKTKVEE